MLELRVLALYRQSVPVKSIVKVDRAVKSYSLQDPEGVSKTLDSSVLPLVIRDVLVIFAIYVFEELSTLLPRGYLTLLS